MSSKRLLTFPDGFLWGTASAAYQCEGGNTNNQWYRWEQHGHICSGDTCGSAADWWYRAESDFALAEQMENNALRLSLEWSRIEPEEGHWDSAVIDRYRALLHNLHDRHIKPLITLHHFTDPLWFADRGGFSDSANIQFFVRFVRYIIAQFQDLCNFWITFNEPNAYASLGHLIGTFPPGEHDLRRALLVMHNLMQAHIEAFYAISELQPDSQIGYCLHYRLFDPANPLWPPDVFAATLQEKSFNWSVLQGAETGNFSFPLNFVMKPLARAAGTRDYHGVNYYTREMIHFDPMKPGELFSRRSASQNAVLNDHGSQGIFGEIYPQGLYRVLKSVYKQTRGNKPLYITENGFCDAKDDRRPRAILEHLAMVHRAITEGIPVRGYLHWTLVDNFEWAEGWSARFGLIELDQYTQKRIPRGSASMFGEICRANAITEEVVERYAPDALETIFGSARRLGSAMTA
jgi:beta-glucosidase